MKIFYCGLQYNNYDVARGESFEHENFYGVLSSMERVAVSYFPFDSIKQIGRERYNNLLIEAVKKERPDMVFVFMISDELLPDVLKELKKYTTTVAWYADDHWRIWNYSRRFAPYFSWNITTWSKAPEIYARLGIKNVIRSQWAANPTFSKAEGIKKDIEVSFVGQRNSAREKIISNLRKMNIPLWVRGLDWPDGRLSREDVVKTFLKSKINLNFNNPPSRFDPRTLGRILIKRSADRLVPDFHIIQNLQCWWHANIPQIKARPFEVLACNAFLITSRADDMEKYYEDEKEIVYYDGTVKDLAEKIRYYLPRDEKRAEIAKAGYERTLREHTYEKRFEEIFKKIRLLH